MVRLQTIVPRFLSSMSDDAFKWACGITKADLLREITERCEAGDPEAIQFNQALENFAKPRVIETGMWKEIGEVE